MSPIKSTTHKSLSTLHTSQLHVKVIPIHSTRSIDPSHRVILAPLTRVRANNEHVPAPTAPTYYAQRGSTPGTLLISEATFIAQRAGGLRNAPGIWSDDQIREWKKVTDAVHAKGSFIYLQLWALGRAASAEQLKSEDPSLEVVSASDVPFEGGSVPRPLTKEEIQEYVKLYATAARNAVETAGFDGVEIHNANGYLLDQFLQTNSNKRTDEYGGSVENRTRFSLQVAEAVTKAIGQDRIGIRFSPWSEFQGMRMPDADIHATFSHIVTCLRDLYPNLSYIHVVEPRISGNMTIEYGHESESNDFINAIWAPRPLIRAGQFDRQSAIELAEKTDNLVAFGRHYISNPDLPARLKHNVPLTPYDRSVFYLSGDQTGKGYTDYPFAENSRL